MGTPPNAAEHLSAAIERTVGVPVAGVNIRDLADKATWTVQCLASATEAQRRSVAAFVANYDPAGEAASVKHAAARAAFDQAPALLAVVLWAADRLGVDRRVARDEILAIYQTL